MQNREIHLIFRYEFKLGHNVREAAKNVNYAFGKGTTADRTAQRYFQRFRTADTSLIVKEGRGRLQEIDAD